MKYKPLDFASFEFRLLETLPCRRGEAEEAPVRCTLYHSSLIEPPAYRALSYCWGDPFITKSIIIDGHIVQVTANLEAALRQLRALNLSAYWIDAICINQADLTERGLQVMRMDRIFSSATEVIAWLGEDADGACLAIKQVRDHKIHGTPAPWSFYPESCAAPDVVGRFPNYSNIRAQSRGTPFEALFNRPFWARIWIIQEVAKAKKLQIFVGDQMLSWEIFEILFVVLQGIPRHITLLLEFRAQEQEGGPSLTLYTAIGRSTHFKSTDARDKIYALLGLTSDGPQLVPTPNYVQSPDVIYFQCLKALILKCEKMSYLFRQTQQLTQPLGNSVPPAWSSLGSGVPGWMFSLLQIATPVPKSPRRVRGRKSLCFPIENSNLPRKKYLLAAYASSLPCLYFGGLVIFVRMLDSIRTIASLAKIPIPKSYSKHIETVESTLNSNRLSAFSRMQRILEGRPKQAESSINTAVLSDFYNALKNLVGEDGRSIDTYEIGEIRAAHIFTRHCTRSNWEVIANPVSSEDWFSNWAHANQEFSYYGKSLREWTDLYSITDAYKTQCLSETGAWKNLLLRLVSNRNWENDLRSILGGERSLLEAMAKATTLQLRLAVTEKSTMITQVSRGVREGDLVCFIPNQQKPIILRKDELGYRFVCETNQYSESLLSGPFCKLGRKGASLYWNGFDGERSWSSDDETWETITIR